MSENEKGQSTVAEQKLVATSRKAAHSREWWAKHIKKCKADGMTMVDYARSHLINTLAE
ncbi:MAG: hypothetical protein QNJ97_07525 [Myxococcota bacterium]|nr:hypothetical protein [Myxococcota bacterium]